MIVIAPSGKKLESVGMINLKDIDYIEEIEVEDSVAMSGWDYVDPEEEVAGYFYDKDGNKHFISLNDPKAIDLADQQLTDGIFQFNTDLAKQILQNGVRNFYDLLLFNAMGHPGPMQCVAKGTLVNTLDGLKKIEEISQDDSIAYLNYDESILYTKEFSVLEGNYKDMLEIELEDGRKYELTDYHRVLVERDDDFCYIMAGDLKESDCLVEVL